MAVRDPFGKIREFAEVTGGRDATKIKTGTFGGAFYNFFESLHGNSPARGFSRIILKLAHEWRLPADRFILVAMRRIKLALVLATFALTTQLAIWAQQSSTSQAADTGTLQVIGKSGALTLTLADLKAMPHITVTVHNPHTSADETYSGVRLADLLLKVGAPLGKDLHGEALANYVVAIGTDGYKAVLALGEIDPSFHPGEVLVADSMDGKPLDAHSGPLKLVVSEDKRPARSVRNLVTIELKSAL